MTGVPETIVSLFPIPPALAEAANIRSTNPAKVAPADLNSGGLAHATCKAPVWPRVFRLPLCAAESRVLGFAAF